LKSVFHLITTISRGGAENQLLILVKEQIKQGLKVHVVYLKGDPELRKDFESSGALVHSELSKLLPLIQPMKFRQMIKGESTVVHAHLPRAELIALFTFTRFKLFTSRHNAEPFFPGAPRLVSNFLSRLIEIRANKIIAISNAVKDFLVSRGEVSDSENIEVVHYGYHAQCEGKAHVFTPTDEIVKLGTISRLTDQKDLPTMLCAFSAYLVRSGGSSLSILGAGPLEIELKEFSKQMGIAESVVFVGRSPLIYDFLIRLDAFVLTSKYEGFGMVLLEAMDAGVPIIASRNSAIPEVLGDDFPGLCTTGDVEDFCQKIDRLNDPRYRQMILDRQNKRLKLFDAEVMRQKIEKIYSL
jgi:glycosyltransferase involved in cell wall biosynthesis